MSGKRRVLSVVLMGVACAGAGLRAGHLPAASTTALRPSPAPAHLQDAPSAPTPPAPQATPYRTVVDQYCVGCHNPRAKNGDLVLQGLDLDHPEAHAEIWEKVIAKLRAGTMPPGGARRPDTATVHGLVDWLQTTIDRAALSSPQPGRPTVHRLNRVEYTNAI